MGSVPSSAPYQPSCVPCRASLKGVNVIPTMGEISQEDREAMATQRKAPVGKRTCRLGDKWDSLLPQALAVVTDPPLHIFEVIGGSTKVRVGHRTKEQGDGTAGVEPILLIRSCSGFWGGASRYVEQQGDVAV